VVDAKVKEKSSLKRPTIYFIIIDFLVALIMCIVLFEVEYTGKNEQAAREKIGRIIMSVMLFVKVIISSFCEWARSNIFKPYLIDP
jgi:uncharacterized protein (UPF0212 family)